MSHYLLAGASGFLGTHLREALVASDHTVTRLVRRPAEQDDESTWDPYTGVYDRAAVEAADVVVNLAGAPTLGNPHSKKWAHDLRESRITTTTVLARAIADAERRPAFLAGNGISVYGDHHDAVLTEESESLGEEFLAAVSRDWEAAAEPARTAGARVCILRTAPVMDAHAPPLKQQRLQFLAGVGGRLGDGRQHMAMISLRDWVGAVVHLGEHADASGPFNLTAPTPPTNAEFTKAFASLLHRPAFAHVPAVVLRATAGKMAPELLRSLNVRPAALLASGYVFHDADVDAILRAALASSS